MNTLTRVMTLSCLATCVAILPSLTAQTISVSSQAPIGEPLVLELDTGVPNVPYRLDLSVDGTSPGFVLPITNRIIPLNRPWIYTDLSGAALPNVFVGFDGLTDQFGRATAIVNVPQIPSLIGLGIDASFVTVDPLSPDGIGVIASPAHFQISAASTGWTTLTPSSDTRHVYVSSSLGNDSNAGLSENDPVRTLARGVSLLRSGFPDWLHLRRGDVWVNESFANWNRSGRSAPEPMVTTTFGNGIARPMIRTSSSAGLSLAQGVHHVAFVGFHLVPESRQASTTVDGVRILGPASDILLEDVCIEAYATNIVVQVWSGPISDFRLRRSLILDSYCSIEHSQGAFFKEVDGILLEENVFDHNGWKEGPNGAPATIYNHNVYLQADNDNLVARGNMFTRGADGLMVRCGGIVEDNLCVRNPVGINFGVVWGSSGPRAGGVSGVIARNVILESNDLPGSGTEHGHGLWVGNVNATGVMVSDNVVAHEASAGSYAKNMALWLNNGVGVHNATLTRNTVYDCRGYAIDLIGSASGGSGNVVTDNQLVGRTGTRSLIYSRSSGSPAASFGGNTYFSTTASGSWFYANSNQMSFSAWTSYTGELGATNQQPNFVDPHRSVATYSASIGGIQSLDGFMSAVRQQSRANWNPVYTAAAVNAYVRAGFMTQ